MHREIYRERENWRRDGGEVDESYSYTRCLNTSFNSAKFRGGFCGRPIRNVVSLTKRQTCFQSELCDEKYRSTSTIDVVIPITKHSQLVYWKSSQQGSSILFLRFLLFRFQAIHQVRTPFEITALTGFLFFRYCWINKPWFTHFRIEFIRCLYVAIDSGPIGFSCVREKWFAYGTSVWILFVSCCLSTLLRLPHIMEADEDGRKESSTDRATMKRNKIKFFDSPLFYSF